MVILILLIYNFMAINVYIININIGYVNIICNYMAIIRMFKTPISLKGVYYFSIKSFYLYSVCKD